MKHIIIFCLLSIISTPSISQDFDSKLKDLAQDIALKINKKESKKVAVWGFTTESSDKTPLGNYLTEDFSVYITNFGESFEVIDRNHLDVILKEHKLNNDGYIDSQTAKKLGKIIAVDVIITGTYTVVGSKIKIRVKALDTETALQFAASIANLPINEDISSYLGISLNGKSSSNKGFNRPINSNESYNDPSTVDKNCEKNKTGDVCFFNSTKKKVVLYTLLPPYKVGLPRNNENKISWNTQFKKIYVNSGETKCVYSLPDEIMQYHIIDLDILKDKVRAAYHDNTTLHKSGFIHCRDTGELNIESCKSKTYTIK